MKNLKNEFREWVFEKLLRLIFKFSNSHTLVKFVRIPKGVNIYYDIQIKSVFKENPQLELHLSEYLEKYVMKNSVENPSSKEDLIKGAWVEESEGSINKATINYVVTKELFKIRSKVMNLTVKQWNIVNSKNISSVSETGYIFTTIKNFYDVVGFSGGMFLTSLCNEEEKRFIRLFYEYGISRQN